MKIDSFSCVCRFLLSHSDDDFRWWWWEHQKQAHIDTQWRHRRSFIRMNCRRDEIIRITTQRYIHTITKMKLATFFNLAFVHAYGGEGNDNQVKSLGMTEIRYVYDNPICSNVAECRGQNGCDGRIFRQRTGTISVSDYSNKFNCLWEIKGMHRVPNYFQPTNRTFLWVIGILIELWSKVHRVQKSESKSNKTMITSALRTSGPVVLIGWTFKVVRKTRTINITNLVVFVQTKMTRENFTMRWLHSTRTMVLKLPIKSGKRDRLNLIQITFELVLTLIIKAQGPVSLSTTRLLV